MFIKLTNAVKEHDGKQIVINTRYIVSIFSGEENGEPATFIHSALQSNWAVKETIEQINKMLGSQND